MAPAIEYCRLIQESLAGQALADFPHAAMATDAEQRVIWTNAAFENLYGYKAEAIVGLPARILYGADVAPKLLQSLQQQIFVQRLAWSGTCVHRHRTGKTFATSLVATPLDYLTAAPVNGVFCVSSRELDAVAIKDALLAHLIRRCFSLSLETACHTPGNRKPMPPHPGPRQLEIQRLLLLGYRAKEIASLLNISTSTVGVVRWKLGLAKKRKPARRKPRVSGA
jgi:PAS domain S-box-containing protein